MVFWTLNVMILGIVGPMHQWKGLGASSAEGATISVGRGGGREIFHPVIGRRRGYNAHGQTKGTAAEQRHGERSGQRPGGAAGVAG